MTNYRLTIVENIADGTFAIMKTADAKILLANLSLADLIDLIAAGSKWLDEKRPLEQE